MKIEKMGSLEYKYIFEIDIIKQSLYICLLNSAKLYDCSLKKNDYRRIKAYTKEFKQLSYKLLHKESVDTIAEYIDNLNALIIINLKIQTILQNKIYRKNREVRKLEYEYSKINKLLGAESSFQLFLDNHQGSLLIIALILISLTFVFLFILCYRLKQLIGIYILSILICFTYMIIICKIDFILDMLHSDRSKRMLSNHTYTKSIKMKKIHNTTNKLIDKL